MKKLIYNYEEAKLHIVNAVNMIANPVIQTLSPRGGNVMFEDETGMVTVPQRRVTPHKGSSGETSITKSTAWESRCFLVVVYVG